MKFLPRLFANNRAWAASQIERDPGFFGRLCSIQHPDYLWFGCSDSRVPANTIVGLDPGLVFVHRNIANLVPPGDANALSVLQYAVDVLQVNHVIVCGHYGCGGVRAAMGGVRAGEPLEGWLAPLRALHAAHAAELASLPDEEARWRRMCELNVMAQVRTLESLPAVAGAWRRGQPLTVHGWIYDLRDGLLHDLGVDLDGPHPRPAVT